MERTDLKLNEAKFFFEMLQVNEGKYPEFDYYLNAYFGSARAVLWVMKAEYSKVEGWKEWYEKKTPGIEIEGMLKKIVDARNRSLKQEPLKTEEYITVEVEDGNFVDIEEKMNKFSKKKVEIEIKIPENSSHRMDETEKELHIVGKLKVSNTIKEFKNVDILEICKKYISWLNEIVNECEKRFG